MTETVPEPQGGPAAEKPNPFQRIVGVLFAPTPTFESIARRPDVLVPLAIVVLLTIVSGIALARVLDFNAIAREAIETAPNTAQMSPEQMERVTKFSAATMKVMSYASPFIAVLILAITAGILLIAFRLMAGDGDFRQAFSVTTYAWYPRLLKALLATVVLMNRKSLSVFDLQNPLRSNPAFLFNPKTQPVAFALATSFDVFSIWSLVLLVIGFAAISKLSRTRSAAIVIVLWVIGTLFSLIGPAIQAMRMHS